MRNYSHETVRTEDIRYEYRRFGNAGTVPLLFLEYFSSNMDGGDPAVTNSLAADHEVILFDYAGVEASKRNAFHSRGDDARLRRLLLRTRFEAIDVVGFSPGGMIAQQLALDHPHLVQRLILLGTRPRGGEGMTFTELSPKAQADRVAFLLVLLLKPVRLLDANT